MEELQKHVKDLVVMHLFAGIRDYNGHLDREKQSRIFLKMIATDKTENLFSYLEEESSWRWGDQKAVLIDLVKSIPEKQKEQLNRDKNEILKIALKELIEKMGTEDAAKAKAALEADHAKQIAHLASEIRYGKPAQKVTWLDKLRSQINVPYAIVLIALILFLGALTFRGLLSNPEVSIEFNVGEIIGGLLVGAGAAVAGIAYAIKGGTPDRERRR
ncbi:MAG: hypothetical protein D8M57_11200 [Candidatus Scalindua sp. AMX11]|nr:MAG: hypothetical protein DWQ00_06725 [Candidatus Scalindua sp.]NOG83451.1 hypothetical protein [Planctomycetota bacterium]RZV72933.1 MAG: hypothetical protein EX341_14005 [Candidatus Scalindua sp. SCAELEC01]TDE64770.1 MAG: hypothetical protein D8M57_11200 [Candidatus Scalindua sp. AMX11]GJQ59849.1 MAG: hypothetical protein SCALA701_26500 [Candidatus Scalindua sp.]